MMRANEIMRDLEKAEDRVKALEKQSRFNIYDPVDIDTKTEKNIAVLSHYAGNTTVLIGDNKNSIELEWRDALALGKWLVSMFDPEPKQTQRYLETLMCSDYRGEHKIGENYRPNDRVTYINKIYTCKKQHTAGDVTPIEDETLWEPVNA